LCDRPFFLSTGPMDKLLAPVVLAKVWVTDK
jgi:hypothetical protein